MSGSRAITTSMVGTDAWVVPHSELDIANIAGFESAIANAARVSRRYVFVDLTNLTFVDAAGIGAIVRAAKDLNSQARHLKLLGAIGQVQYVLDLTRVSELLGIEADLLDQTKTTGL